MNSTAIWFQRWATRLMLLIGTKVLGAAVLSTLVLATLLSAILVLGSGATLARAELATFRFEAELMFDPGPAVSIFKGQKVSGRYTFETNTPPQSVSSLNTVTFYHDALTDVVLHVHGHGTARGDGTDSYIYLGDPTLTTGSYVFLSDAYTANARATGVALPGRFGSVDVVGMRIHLQDLDMVGLASETLLPTPPDLKLFRDNAGPNYDSDHAYFYLAFEDFGSYEFQLTRLALIPEPSTVTLVLLAAGLLTRRVRYSSPPISTATPWQ
jgi:hypothetical protein